MDVNKKIYMWIDEKIIDEKSKTKHAICSTFLNVDIKARVGEVLPRWPSFSDRLFT